MIRTPTSILPVPISAARDGVIVHSPMRELNPEKPLDACSAPHIPRAGMVRAPVILDNPSMCALPFESPYRHGFVRVAVCTPRVDLARPSENARATLSLAREAGRRRAALALFPELGISGYSLEDLVQQDALLDAVEAALAEIIAASVGLGILCIVGAPLRLEQRLFNCAVLVLEGAVLGVVPKTYLPTYREFYERRQYSSARQAQQREIVLAGRCVPFGSDLLFRATNRADFTLHVEICEDLWVPVPPSSLAALAGATVLANLSASDVTVGKAAYRRLLCRSHSARCLAASLYAAAGFGESTTDLAWDGQAMICENGDLLAEARRFSYEAGLICADIDLDRLRQERMRMTSFNDCSEIERARLAPMRSIEFELPLPSDVVPLERRVPRYPFVASDPTERDERCAEVYAIQTQGLVQRLRASGCESVVVGLSGGLDSTLALLVATAAADRLGWPRTRVIACSLPGLATSERTRELALGIARAQRVHVLEIDLRPAIMQMLRDIEHPYARGERLFDTTFENVQAGERASHLFRLANRWRGLVLGTSDLSELALGYTTYGVGDQMSHYAVNASVPKTLVRHLIEWTVRREPGTETAALLERILALPSTPELIPADSAEAQAQSAEQAMGPYALHDFFLYYHSRFGMRPSKIAFLAHAAWRDRRRGEWPSTVPEHERAQYTLEEVVHHLKTFLTRFFANQFKRSALPNGPKIGSGGSLSPRSDWRAPSDAPAQAWLEELVSALEASPDRK